MDYELSYGGTPFLGDLSRVYRAKGYEEARKHEPLADLMDELERLIPSRYLQDLAPSPPASKNTIGLAAPARPPQDPRAERVKVGDWYYPTTASRFSVFRGLATSSMVKTMLATTGGTGTATFIMKAVPVGATTTNTYSLSTSMYMLPPRPLGEADKKFDGLFLVTLVDERFYFGGSPITLRPDTSSTWTGLINQCATNLGITITITSAISSVYGQPEPDSPLWCNFENAALLLDALATNVGRVVIRNLNGTYTLNTHLESRNQVVTNRGTNVLRVAGGDLFNSGNLLVAGSLNSGRNSVVPAAYKVTFPKYIYGADPVPHFLNPRTTSGRGSVWNEEGYGEVHALTITPSLCGATVSGLAGVGMGFIRTDAKAYYSTEALAASGMSPGNIDGLTALATRVATDRYEAAFAAALDEVYPGTFVWTPEGLHDIVWTYSEKQGLATTRVMHSEWNVPTEEGQYAIPFNGTYLASGVGGRSVAQTWRDNGGNIQFGVNLVTAGAGLTLTKGVVTSGGITEAIVAGGSALLACKTVALGNLSLTGAQTVNGTSITSGDRVLLSAQTSALQNGPAVANGNTWTRPADYPSAVSMGPGLIVPVEVGDVGANSVWIMTGSTAAIVDTDSTSWVDIDKLALIKAAESFNSGTIWLTATTDSFEVLLGEAIATSNLPWTLDYSDSDTNDTTGAPAPIRGFTTGVSAKTLAYGIAGTRYMQHFSVDNIDTITHTVKFQINFNGTVRQQIERELAVGQSLHFDAKGGEWYIFPPQATSGGVDTAFVNNQTGTSYTVVDSDRDKLVTFSNASSVTVVQPQAGASSQFASGWYCSFQNRGVGTVTINPTTSTIDGAATLTLLTGQGCWLHSDGSNYFTERGIASATGNFTNPIFIDDSHFTTGPLFFGSWTSITANVYSWWTINILNGCTVYAGVPPVTPTVAPILSLTGSGGSLSAGSYYLKYTNVGADNAESAPSSESNVATVSGSQSIFISLPVLDTTTTSFRNLYLTAADGGSGTEILIQTNVTSTSVTYTGIADNVGTDLFPIDTLLPATQPVGGPVAASCLTFPTTCGKPYWSDSCGSVLFDRCATPPTLWGQLTYPTGTAWRSIIGTKTPGDMIYGATSTGDSAILGIGVNGSIMVVVGGVPTWVTPSNYNAAVQQVLTHVAGASNYAMKWEDVTAC